MCIRDRQFVYGISLYTDMHVAPVDYFRQTLYIVIGYVHATGISYFSFYDYNLAMVSVQGMIDICLLYTSRKANIPGIEVCGKTGTAQNRGKDHSAFMGFAPMNDPKICLLYTSHISRHKISRCKERTSLITVEAE